MKQALLIGALLLAGTALHEANASTFNFSYNSGGDKNLLFWGQGLRQNMDVAIKLEGASVEGMKVLGFKVRLGGDPTGDKPDLSNVSGWLSSELKLKENEDKKMVADPDIVSVEGDLQPDGKGYSDYTVTFPEPYTIPAGGVYVGYSFRVPRVSAVSKNPIELAYGDNVNGLYLHNTTTSSQNAIPEWLNMNEAPMHFGGVSAMVVLLEGETEAIMFDVAGRVSDLLYAQSNTAFGIPMTFTNWGSDEISSVDYTVTAKKKDGTEIASHDCHYDLPTPVKNQLGITMSDTLPVEDGFDYEGECDLVVTITKANGEALDAVRTFTVNAKFLKELFINRPLVEEFTGLNCGYCPYGYVTLEVGKEEFGKDYIAMAYHAQQYETGCMEVVGDANFPVSIKGFPNACINRGVADSPLYLPDDWEKARSNYVNAGLDVKAEWADDTRSKINATVTYKFDSDFENDDKYALSIALVADGLQNVAWRQSNYIVGQKPPTDNPMWEIFTRGGGSVSGLIFNDVVVSYKKAEMKKGIAGSIENQIEAFKEYTFNYEFDNANIKNLRGKKFVNPGAKYRVIAMVIDKNTNKIVNSNSSWDDLEVTEESAEANLDWSGVEAVGSDAEVVSVSIYDLQGVKVTDPMPGEVYIVVRQLSDGTTQTFKNIF